MDEDGRGALEAALDGSAEDCCAGACVAVESGEDVRAGAVPVPVSAAVSELECCRGREEE